MSEPSAIDVFEYLDFRAFLRDYYIEQKAQRQLSYRKFAQEASLKSPNYLKLVIDGARKLSPAMARRFAKAIGLIGESERYFLNLVRFNQAVDSEERSEAYELLTGFRRYQSVHKLDFEHAAFHSHWYLPAIRELAASKAFRGDPDWIAKHLRPRIKRADAARALEILLSLGLLVRDERGNIKQGEPVVSTGAETRGLHIRAYHREMIDRGKHSLDAFTAKQRDISSLTLCLGEDGLKLLKERIRRFRRELVDLSVLEDDPRQVVQVNFQLFPLSEVCRSSK